jgi:hypothetical protein
MGYKLVVPRDVLLLVKLIRKPKDNVVAKLCVNKMVVKYM